MLEKGTAKRLIHEETILFAALAEYCQDYGTLDRFFFIPSDCAT